MEAASYQAAHQADPVRPARTGPHALVEALAFFLPFAGAMAQTRGDALWRSDGALLSALEGHASFQGALGGWLTQLTLLLPMGNLPFRAALVGAIFCGIAGVAVLHLSHTLFRKQGGYSRLDAWLAIGASISASFNLPWMSEATVAGGAAVGGGLALALIYLLLSGGLPRTMSGSLLGGALLGALMTESGWAAGFVVAAALIVWPESHSVLRGRPGARLRHFARIMALIGSAAGTAALLWLPALTSHSAVALYSWSETTEAFWPLWSPLTWIGSIGFLFTAGALFSLFFSLEDRRPLYALALFIAADILAPGNAGHGWTSAVEVDPNRLGLHLTALALVAPLGALGLRTLSETAQALELFAARPLAAMVAVLAVAGCLASAEDSLRTLSQTGSNGPQTWTDEALQNLPDDTLVLTKSPAWGRRLLAAQSLGERPDVLIVPLGDVTRPATLRSWLDKEPRLETLLRDLSITETPSERAITRLVDHRPVLLEPDPTWDRRLLEHVRPTIPLATFSSHALGRSDRVASLEAVSGPTNRIVQGYQDGLTEDVATKDTLLRSFDEMKATLDAVKDGAASRGLEALRPDAEKASQAKEEKTSETVAQR